MEDFVAYNILTEALNARATAAQAEEPVVGGRQVLKIKRRFGSLRGRSTKGKAAFAVAE